MDYPNEKGVTNRQELNIIWEQTGSKPEKYKDITVSPCGEDLFRIFWDLRSTTSEHITWSDIYFYCLYNDIRLNGYEIKIIQKLNTEVNKWISKKVRTKHNKKVTSRKK